MSFQKPKSLDDHGALDFIMVFDFSLLLPIEVNAAICATHTIDSICLENINYFCSHGKVLILNSFYKAVLVTKRNLSFMYNLQIVVQPCEEISSLF
jgi:hypothetical protein